MRRSGGAGRVISMSEYLGVREAGPGVCGHLDLVRLAGYGRGEIDGAEGDAILAHCRGCRSCGDQLAMILVLLEIKERRARRKRHVLLAVGATIVAAAAVGVGFLSSGPMLDPGAASDGVAVTGGSAMPGRAGDAAPTIIDSATAPELGRALATTEGPDRVDLEFMFPEAGAIIPLSGAGRADKRTPFGLLVDGRYGEAVENLTNAREQHPADDEIAVLLGMALYLNGNDGDAAEALLQQRTRLRRHDLQHTAAWYLANLYLRRGDVVKGTLVLQELSEWPDSPGTKAAELLTRLRSEAR